MKSKKLKFINALTIISYTITIAAFIGAIIISRDQLWLVGIFGIVGAVFAIIGYFLFVLSEKTRLSHCPNCDADLKDVEVDFYTFNEVKHRGNRKTVTYIVKGTCPKCGKVFEHDVCGKSDDLIYADLMKKLKKIYTKYQDDKTTK